MTSSNFFQSVLSAITNLAPYHLLSFSALLGTELYQTFIITKVAYDTLPRTSFTTLQKKLFPLYFQGQSLLLFLTAVTFPPYGPVSLIQKKGDWIPFAVAGVAAAFNLKVYGPRTRQSMIDRIHQGDYGGSSLCFAVLTSAVTRDATKANNSEEPSPEMVALNRRFKRNHAMSIHLNLVSIGATLWYGWGLASKLQY
ncbi:hypothetical protein G7046_g4281 [Stylonectria norvegica]|nr:hypothetical protein G7046_g4281 [Stylonectria norvegica]